MSIWAVQARPIIGMTVRMITMVGLMALILTVALAASAAPPVDQDEYKLSLHCEAVGCKAELKTVRKALDALGKLEWKPDEKKCLRMNYYLLSQGQTVYARARQRIDDESDNRCKGQIDRREISVKIRSDTQPETLPSARGDLTFKKLERDVSLHEEHGKVQTDAKWSATWEWAQKGESGAAMTTTDVAAHLGVSPGGLTAGGYTLYARPWELGTLQPSGAESSVTVELEQVLRRNRVVDSEISFKGKRSGGTADPAVEQLAKDLAAKLLAHGLLASGFESKAALAFAPCD